MAEITVRDGQPLSEEEKLAVLIELGMTEEGALFVLAVSSGEIAGDLVTLSDGETDESTEIY